MDLDLTQEQDLVRDTVGEFARERIAPVAEELDRESRFPYELVAELGELGLMGLPIPEEYGGAGGDTVSYALAIEELRDGQWVVNGSKMFITNAGTDISALVTITARTGESEISNIVVPNGTDGYEISAPLKKLGWKASDTRELSFRDVTVPEENLLGPRGQGFHQFLEILDGGRISVAAMGVGLAQGAYDLAYDYAQEREQFG